MIERAVIKRNAKDQLRGKWGLAIAAFIISGIISSILFIIGSAAESSTITTIGGLVAIIIGGPIAYGLISFVLNIVRGKDASVSDIFSGFNGKVFVKSFVIFILMSLAIGIGYIIFVIPGIILALMFSQSYYVLYDNNDMSAIDCMKASCNMMKSHKMELFVLILSFIGWFILGEITFGIGLLWVMPYYMITLGNYYEALNGTSSKTL